MLSSSGRCTSAVCEEQTLSSCTRHLQQPASTSMAVRLSLDVSLSNLARFTRYHHLETPRACAGASRVVGFRLELDAGQAQRAQAGLAVGLHVVPGQLLQPAVQGVGRVQALIDDGVSALHRRRKSTDPLLCSRP